MGLKGRSLRTLHDLTDREMAGLLALAAQLKAARVPGRRGTLLDGRQIALVFEKSSTRTRCAAFTAATSEGGATEYLEPGDIHLGQKESVKDTARVLGRMFDGILFRGYSQRTVETLAEWAGIPVWNGLTDDAHPTQILADLLTMQESFGRLRGLKVCYLGDGRNNVANSLMLGCAKAGIHFANATPAALQPQAALVEVAREIAGRNGSSVDVVEDPMEGVVGANVLYTDVWVSMGEESVFEQRVALLQPYQVTEALMQATGGLRDGSAIFLHCLPAFHDHETKVTRDRGPLEVTDEVFEASYSKVFDQAENRVHTLKALMAATVSGVSLPAVAEAE